MRHDASLEGEVEGAPAASHVDNPPYAYRFAEADAAARRRRTIGLAVAALVIAAAGVGYYYWAQQPATQPAAPPAPPPVAETRPAPAPESEAAIQHPIEAAKPEVAAAPEPVAPLPALDVSDQPVTDAVAGVLDRAAIDEYLIPSGLVRRIVVTVDNLPRKKAPQRMWPVKPTAGAFMTTGGDTAYLAEGNARRYEPFLKVMESVDAGKLAALYVRFYPLFQQAYRELGYPKGYFNDRLVEVIDHLLVTPEVAGPIKLTKPWIMYEFADPALEARSAGQKALIRMGPANAQRVKAKLREFRRQIAGRAITATQ